MATAQDDLFLAILSMDAYNRTISDTNISVGLNVTGNKIGNADLGTPSGNTSSGFFAQSYDLSGSKVADDETCFPLTPTMGHESPP